MIRRFLHPRCTPDWPADPCQLAVSARGEALLIGREADGATWLNRLGWEGRGLVHWCCRGERRPGRADCDEADETAARVGAFLVRHPSGHCHRIAGSTLAHRLARRAGTLAHAK